MAEQHRATPEQWETIERMRHHVEFSCLLEMRDRIEALEDAAKPHHPAQPDSSLVERVANTLRGVPVNPQLEARAAIRAVAQWLRENPDVYFPPDLVFALEQEAER